MESKLTRLGHISVHISSHQLYQSEIKKLKKYKNKRIHKKKIFNIFKLGGKMEMANNFKLFKFAFVIFLLALTIFAPTASGKVRLVEGAYQDIIVDLRETLPVGNCTAILSGLEKILTSASHHLYTALDGRAHFGKIVINLPTTWPDTCVPSNRSAVTPSTGEKSDLTVTQTHHLFGDRIWTKQSGGCGTPGDQIYASYKNFDSQTISKEFVREWAKYRYGVFDEIGYDDDQIYPKCYFTDSQHITGCSDGNIKDTGICHNGSPYSDLRKVLDKRARTSIMFVPQAEHITMFCGDGTHDRYAPTKHNLLCNRRSTMDVIMQSPDFLRSTGANRNPLGVLSTVPEFYYRRRMLTRYVVIIDETQEAYVRESWRFLRNAIRKWVLYDLRPNTEVGIVLANSTDPIRSLDIIPLEHQKNRDLVASFVPYVAGESRQSACISCGISAAVRMLVERRRRKGPSCDVVLVIAPGMSPTSDYVPLAEYAIENNVKISAINYPILNNKQPLDKLAEMTSGVAYTVLEQRFNSENSYLNTYFELSMVLFHISAEFHEGPNFLLPIEIHRRELMDLSPDSNQSKRIGRAISGSFYMDETVAAPSGFFLYTHNVEQPLIQNLRLYSPGGTYFGTRSDQRMPVKQLTLIAVINSTGPWTYMIERFNGNPQPHFVQVLATPITPDAAVFHARTWHKKPTGGGPYVLYCEVLRGELPVSSASVEVTITRPDQQCNYSHNCIEKFQLLDSGGGDPDITKGDGIYSRYFSAADTGVGIYKIDIIVNDNGNTAYSLPDNAPYQDRPCCGSEIPNAVTRQTTPFTRYLPPITLMITRDDINEEIEVRTGRVGDLSAAFIENGQVRLTWTTPDLGGHTLTGYEVKYGMSIQDIVDNFDTAATLWQHDVAHPFSLGDVTNLLIDINKEPSLFGRAVFFAVRPRSYFMNENITGLLSNPARTFIPINAKPTEPVNVPNIQSTPNLLGGNGNIHRDFDGIGGASEEDIDIKIKYAIPIIAGLLCVLCVIAMYCIICMFRRHKKNSQNKEKKGGRDDQENKTIKSDPNPAIIQSPTDTTTAQSQYNSPKTSRHSSPVHDMEPRIGGSPVHESVHKYTEHTDHHTIGIPIYSDDCDDRPNLTESMLTDDLTHPGHHHPDHIEIVAPPSIYTSCSGVSIISSNNHTLPRHGRTLSPYESWSASQLLHEHERRISPMEDLVSTSNSINLHKTLPHPSIGGGDDLSINGRHFHPSQHVDRSSFSGGSNSVPPVPPLPFGADGYQPPPNCHPHIYGIHVIPPTYSTISRSHQHTHGTGGQPGNPAGGGGTNSIIGGYNNKTTSIPPPSNLPNSGDKRRRNVTMV